MSANNLQEVLDAAGNIVELPRGSQLGAYIYPVVPAEFTKIEDYYTNPWEILGYGSFVKFYYDFVGRDASCGHRRRRAGECAR